jgi:predicted transcriptional regulator
MLDILSHETERDILLYLIANPGTSQKELADFASLSAGSVNWHMKRLIGAGLVEARREGPFVSYWFKGEPSRLLTLLQDYRPRIWERWADRLADLLA